MLLNMQAFTHNQKVTPSICFFFSLTDRIATRTLAYLHIMNLNVLLLLNLHFVAGHSC